MRSAVTARTGCAVRQRQFARKSSSSVVDAIRLVELHPMAGAVHRWKRHGPVTNSAELVMRCAVPG